MGKYDDIISLPHHVSDSRAQMSREARAAQFSPFAALTGYEDLIDETARLTDERLELDDDTKEKINRRLQMLIDRSDENPKVSITYFKPDEKKTGGSYITISGDLKKLNELEKIIMLKDGTKIQIDSIYALEGEIFNVIEDTSL